MGIGLFFDGMTYAMGKGSQKVLKQIQDRNASVSKQSTEAAVAQIREGEIQFRADKCTCISTLSRCSYIRGRSRRSTSTTISYT